MSCIQIKICNKKTVPITTSYSFLQSTYGHLTLSQNQLIPHVFPPKIWKCVVFQTFWHTFNLNPILSPSWKNLLNNWVVYFPRNIQTVPSFADKRWSPFKHKNTSAINWCYRVSWIQCLYSLLVPLQWIQINHNEYDHWKKTVSYD